jgi:nicotinamidase-related amidase
MKKIIICLLLVFVFYSSEAQKSYALLVIDIQNFYFPGGRAELVDPVAAAEKAALAIAHARTEHQPVIFVQHKSSEGMEINSIVRPLPGEAIFVKEDVNSFLNTGLEDHLRKLGTDTLVICGMQTHMCVEAAVRAAHDLGYKVILLHDACATRNLKYGDREIAAADVHASTLATLKSYGSVVSVADWVKE